MLVGIHQPNFIPPFPYFVKMAVCDTFVLMCQPKYSNENFQNFNTIMGKKWTLPVAHEGFIPSILEKRTAEGKRLAEVNCEWIMAIADTLGIDTDKMVADLPTEKKGTDRIIEIVKHYGGDSYIANASAPEKYLDVKALEQNGIKFVPLVCEEKRNVIDLFNDIGIKATTELLYRTVAENKYRKMICKT